MADVENPVVEEPEMEPEDDEPEPLPIPFHHILTAYTALLGTILKHCQIL